MADLFLRQLLTCELKTLPPFETLHNSLKNQNAVLRQLSEFPRQIFSSRREIQVKFPSLGCSVSQNVYTDTVPLIPNVLTFTPSKGSWSPSTLSLSRDRLSSNYVFLKIWGQPRIKRPKVVWCGKIYGYVYTEPLQREGAKRFLSCLGKSSGE